jgi:hypothetical protein
MAFETAMMTGLMMGGNRTFNTPMALATGLTLGPAAGMLAGVMCGEERQRYYAPPPPQSKPPPPPKPYNPLKFYAEPEIFTPVEPILQDDYSRVAHFYDYLTDLKLANEGPHANQVVERKVKIEIERFDSERLALAIQSELGINNTDVSVVKLAEQQIDGVEYTIVNVVVQFAKKQVSKQGRRKKSCVIS